uniref:Uncharacterized protein n=1 Tax=Arundo donax TaxID=35708 RepID=A0A0A9CND3_ARUDO
MDELSLVKSEPLAWPVRRFPRGLERVSLKGDIIFDFCRILRMGPIDASSLSKSVPLRFRTCLPPACKLWALWDNEDMFTSLEELGPLKYGERDILYIADRPRNPGVT